MKTLVYYLPAAACVGGMVFCMAMMSRGHSKREQGSDPQNAPRRATDEEVVRLREEVDALRAELQQREGTREPV